jgi:hypothetical protein
MKLAMRAAMIFFSKIAQLVQDVSSISVAQLLVLRQHRRKLQH